MNETIVIESLFLLNWKKPEDGILVGGSQRYTLDLGKLFSKLGYKVIILTKACKDCEFDYEGWAKIVALKAPFGAKGNIIFSKKVYNYCKKIKPKLVCYSDLQIGFPYCYENSFALQHGIAWDNPKEKLKKFIKTYFYIKAMHKFKLIICVDTNFINWCRDRDKKYFSNPQILRYVPNYADEELFNYTYIESKENDTFKLLYPRRLVYKRGFKIFMEMCKILIEKGYNIEPILAFEEFRDSDFRVNYPEYKNMNCRIVHPSMDEIHLLYKEAFLTFIPTIWSEGTSLSAIESMSSGCPVVASDVGGLGNIIIPGFNGYIVPPTVNDFVTITERLLNNIDKRNELSKNCKIINQVFGKSRWEEQIINSIEFLLK